MYGREVNPEPFFRALRANKVLRKLKLATFSFGRSRAQCVAEVTVEKTVLHDMQIQGFSDVLPFANMKEHNTGSVELVIEGFSIADVVPFAEAVHKNEKMEKLTLSWYGTVEGLEPFKDAVVFLKALASNKVLKIFTMKCMHEKAKHFYRILERTGTVDKVPLSASLDNPEVLTSMLKEGMKLSQLSLDLGECDL